MKIRHRIIILLSCWLWLIGTQAQTVRSISVAQGASYTDHISLKEDSKDMDLMVKFVFSEETNTLTVTLISYRSLFVFWDNVHYKPLFKGRKLRPDQLPYVVEYDPKDKYKATKLFKATVPKPRSEFYFKRWIDYEGLQPAPQDYKMVNDYIAQTFDIPNKRTQVTVKLHDVFLMDKTEKKKYNRYDIPFGRDLDLVYQIQIVRNPCFGLDEDVAAAKNAMDGVSKSYRSFKSKYKSGVVGSEESLKLFNELKSTLQQQFQYHDGQSDCQDVQMAWDNYNNYVDSIGAMKCVVQSNDVLEGSGGMASEGITILITKSRQIDRLVSRWLVSVDPIERRDLETQCESLIAEMNALIGKRTGGTPEQRQAIATFRAAERYYQTTCKQ
ncbi:MAG: hypothetical protein J6W56_02620 [Prevotella sp.]|nr:hypothetical protein [Prevotella sp.]